MKKMQKFLYLAFGFVFLINCSSKPSVLDARKVYENIDTNLHSGLIRISKFQKTNAVEGKLAGVKFYRIEYEAEVEFLMRLWEFDSGELREAGYLSIPESKSGFLIPDSLHYEYSPPGGILHLKGDTKRINGILTFEMTEKGWRGEDGNIY
jgi:hypothetical protein